MCKPIPNSDECEKCIHEEVCSYKEAYSNYRKSVGSILNGDENCEFNVSTFCEYHEYRKALQINDQTEIK